MQKTILTIIFALLLALTSWAQKFTISGDLSVMTNKFDLPPAKANIVYIWNDVLLCRLRVLSIVFTMPKYGIYEC
jgi:hypothetical protein